VVLNTASQAAQAAPNGAVAAHEVRIADAVDKATAGKGEEAAASTAAGPQALVSTANGAAVTVARSGSGGIAIAKTDGFAARIGLPTSAAATIASRGKVVYAGSQTGFDTAVQVLSDGSVRVLVVLTGASAPDEYRFPMTMPAGAGLARTADGGVDIVVDGNRIVGRVAAPWAKDANGAAVATSYRIEGNTIVQRVAHSSATAYPVVADPTFGWSWWPTGPAAYFNRGETSFIADASYSDVAVFLLAAFVSNPLYASLAAAQIWSIKSWAQTARNQGACVKLIFQGVVFGDTYTGGNCV